MGNWDRGKPATIDFTVSSPLSSAILSEASAEERKHRANDVKCAELGWSCVPLAVETYGAWGDEAQCTFSRLASLLSVGSAKVRYYLTFMAILTSNLCVPLQELC